MSSERSLLEQLDPTAVLRELDRVDSEESLVGFIKRAWPVLEPGREFVDGWHIHAVCEHLEAVSRGEITRLLINVPPGCMKSLTTNVFWPAWEWGPKNRSDIRYVSSSYSAELTIRDNRRCRNILQSEWYQGIWGHRFQLVGDQNAKIKFETDRAGFKLATSVGGLGTGERGDRFIIDDPHNIKDGESEAKREASLLWFREVVPTRLSNPRKSAIIVIMQRVHEKDVAGYIMSKELGYEHLMLPMEFEPERKCVTCIGFEDPRNDDGQLLWPTYMTDEVVRRDKAVLGQYASAAQFQQRPAPRGGGMFKRDWFEILDEMPVDAVKTVRGWDLAGTETKKSPYTASCRMSRGTDGVFYIEHVNRDKRPPEGAEQMIKDTAAADGPSVEIDIPQDPGQAGKAQVRYLVRQLVGYIVRYSTESGSKETRAEALASQARAGNVKLIRGLWIQDFLDELTVFPFSEFKDQTDAASRAFHALVPASSNDLVALGPQVVKANG